MRILGIPLCASVDYGTNVSFFVRNFIRIVL